jgi:hypothetical protein
MKEKIINILSALLGLLLSPIWLPVTLLLYVLKWLRKGR